MTLLASGHFARGWDEYGWRWRGAQGRPRNFGEAWCGEDIAGHTILLHAEQGLGHASHEQYAQGLGVHALDPISRNQPVRRHLR
jgi:hypothetical protein